MISKKLEEALNEQIREEFYSASYYLSISAWASSQDYNGTASFFMIQVQEEVGHAMKMFNFLFDVESRAIVPALDQPPADFDGLEDAFQKTLKHEKYITGRIHKLVALAREENDYAMENFLQWFVTEQVEEEANMNKVLAQIKMIGGDARAVFMLDRELGQRQAFGGE